jgi:serine/threonine-protein kinase RsbT
VVAVYEELDVFVARNDARRLAARCGFGRRETEEIALVVTELATNLIRHARGGEIRLQPLRDPERGTGLGVTAVDRGPVIRSFEIALLDGHDDVGRIDPTVKRKGIASGLGCVQRLTHELSHSIVDGGNVISAVRWICPPKGTRA